MPVKIKQSYHASNSFVPNHVDVDMGNQKLNTVGANNSVRFPIGVKSETGKITYGFFTQNSYVRKAQEIFDERFQSTLNAPKYKKYESIYNAFISDIQNGDYYKTSVNWYDKLGIRGNGLDGNVGKINGREIIGLYNRKREKNIDIRTELLNYLILKGVSSDFLESEKNNTSFWNYIGSMLSAAHGAGFSMSAQLGAQSHTMGDNINKRNNAMYDTAVLLGEDNIICRSTSMTVMCKGEKYDGSFMINAIGTDRKKWDSNDPLMKNRPIKISADAVKSISKLQILDFLCANVDRHPDNMFYQLDTHSDPNNVRLIGVQGIDNDASFGNIPPSSTKIPGLRGRGYMSYVDDIKVIDKNMADMVLKLTPEELDSKIRLAGLTAEEIEYSHQRLSALQDKITRGDIEILSGEEWKKYEDPQAYKELRYANNKMNSFNIFDNAAFACEEYNKKLSINANKQNQVNNAPKQTPVGTAKNAFENNIVDVHKNEIIRIMADFAEPEYVMDSDIALNTPAGFDDLCRQAKELADHMGKLSQNAQDIIDKSVKANEPLVTFMLTDKERIILLGKMKNLKEAADQFAKNGSEKDVFDKDGGKVNSAYCKKLVNYTKNLSAYLDFASQSVKEDAIEAEKNLASKMAYDLAKEKGLNVSEIQFEDRSEMYREYKTTHTLEDLRKEFENVDKWYKKSSDQFKAMQEELFNFDISKAKNNIDRQIMYNKLIDKAQKYIDYKTPDGKKDGLNDYSRKRVEFAEKIVEFGMAAKYQVNKNEKQRAKDSEMAEKDLRELVRINNKYTPMIRNYVQASTQPGSEFGSEKWKENLKTLWDVREDYAKDYKAILNMSDKYSVDHEMQIAFNKVLSGNMGLYMGIIELGAKKFSDDPKQKSAGSGWNILGMGFDEVHKHAVLKQKAEAAQKKYDLAHPKKVQEPEETKQTVNEGPKFPGLD